MSTAVVVGSGPNGLTAAVMLARAGVAVRVVEAADRIGGGARTEALLRPDVLHDTCSAVHPLGAGSPAFTALRLDEFGLRWRLPELDCAHPLDDGRTAALARSVHDTAAGLGVDAETWRDMIGGLADDFDDIAGAMALYRETLDHWQAEGVPIHRLSYSALTEAPRDTVAALLDALGLPWDDACLSFGGSDRVVATASSLQVRDGIYTGSDGAWQAYAEHLAPLRHALETRGLLAQPA